MLVAQGESVDSGDGAGEPAEEKSPPQVVNEAHDLRAQPGRGDHAEGAGKSSEAGAERSQKKSWQEKPPSGKWETLRAELNGMYAKAAGLGDGPEADVIVLEADVKRLSHFDLGPATEILGSVQTMYEKKTAERDLAMEQGRSGDAAAFNDVLGVLGRKLGFAERLVAVIGDVIDTKMTKVSSLKNPDGTRSGSDEPSKGGSGESSSEPESTTSSPRRLTGDLESALSVLGSIQTMYVRKSEELKGLGGRGESDDLDSTNVIVDLLDTGRSIAGAYVHKIQRLIYAGESEEFSSRGLADHVAGTAQLAEAEELFADAALVRADKDASYQQKQSAAYLRQSEGWETLGAAYIAQGNSAAGEKYQAYSTSALDNARVVSPADDQAA